MKYIVKPAENLHSKRLKNWYRAAGLNPRLVLWYRRPTVRMNARELDVFMDRITKWRFR